MISAQNYSSNVKELIKESRVIALYLGYTYISSIHFFLADCKLNEYGSMKNFAFKNDAELVKFNDDYRNADPILDFNDSLPLTKEAEKVLRQSGLECFLFSQKVIFPHHIFMAATRKNESLLCKCLPGENNLYDKLVVYYTDLRLIDSTLKQSAFKYALRKILFYLG